MRFTFLIATTVCLFVRPALVHAQAGTTATTAQLLFWSDQNDNSIKRMSLSGGPAQTIATASVPQGVAVDDANAKIYWSDGDANTPGKIFRANFDGSNQQVVVSEPVVSGGGTQFVQSLKLDTVNNWIYYTEGNTRTIRRVHFNGTGDQVVVQGTDNGPFHMAWDMANNNMYWTQGRGSYSEIRRAHLDGTAEQIIFQEATGAYAGIEVDPIQGFLYFADYYPGAERIRRVNTDGTNPVTLVNQPNSWPLGTEIDLAAGKLYWAKANSSNPGVFRSNLDGTSVEQLVSLPSNGWPWDVTTAIPEPSAFCVFGVAIVTAVARRRRA